MLNVKTGIFGPAWLDMVFENRNQAYGAYELRQRSDDRTIVSVLSTVGIFVFLIMISFVIAGFSTQPLPERIERVVPSNNPDIFDIPTPPQPPLPPKPPVTQGATQTMLLPVKVDSTEYVEKKPMLDPTLPAGPTGPEIPEGSTGNSAGTPGAAGQPGTIFVNPNHGVEHTYVSDMPKFPGGEDALMQYIYKHLQYPSIAIENNRQGRVMVSFVINHDGSVSDIKIESKKIGWGLEEEVIRVVKLLPRWTPGRQNNETVRVRLTMPVVYKLD